MANNGSTIIEVLEYGPICAADEDTGCLVTVNGSYVNLWVPCGGVINGTTGERSALRYANTDCVSNSEWGDLYTNTGAAMIERAESCLRGWLAVPGEDE
jgi:hypothetical protein